MDLGYIILFVDILFWYIGWENKSWDVGCVIKWYGIIDKVVFKIVKYNFLEKPDLNALRLMHEFLGI